MSKAITNRKKSGGSAPSQYIALIRGINVGRAKRVAMADLRTQLTAQGLRDVASLLNSGNVVFKCRDNSRKAEALISRVLETEMGVKAEVVVLTLEELQRLAAANTLIGVAPDHSRLLITVYGEPSDKARFERLQTQSWDPDHVVVGDQAVYAWCDRGAINSPLAKAVSRAMGPRSTTRNWATISKLVALAASRSI